MSLGWVGAWHPVGTCLASGGVWLRSWEDPVWLVTVSHLPQVWVMFRRACGSAAGG